MHSVQSFLFNRFVNERLKLGLELVEGDLVCGACVGRA